jgi:hypothetical protein
MSLSNVLNKAKQVQCLTVFLLFCRKCMQREYVMTGGCALKAQVLTLLPNELKHGATSLRTRREIN